MKKKIISGVIIAIVLILAMIIYKKFIYVPDGFSRYSYELSKEALKVMEKYNDGKLGDEEAIEELENIDEDLSYIVKSYENDYKDWVNNFKESVQLVNVEQEMSKFVVYIKEGEGDPEQIEADLRERLK